METICDNDGLNIGINIGSVAGASQPDHLHIHFIPHYLAEPTSLITAIGGTVVIEYDIMHFYHALKIESDLFKNILLKKNEYMF